MQIIEVSEDTTLTLAQGTEVGYAAIVWSQSNTSTSFSAGGSDTINGGAQAGVYYEQFVALLTKATATEWTLVTLQAGVASEDPYSDIYTESSSVTLDDDYWEDISDADSRLPMLDAAVIMDSASPTTVTLAGGPTGFSRVFDIVQAGVGAVTIAPDAGYTINGGAGSVVISAQWKKARVYFAGGTEFFVVVDAVQGAPGTELNLITSSADADITAAAGNRYVVDASSYTANRTLTLPTGVVGDKVSVAVIDIADDYSLIITGTGVWGSGEWSRLISQGETVDLLCYSAGSWMISNDGRIPAKCSMARVSAQTGIPDSTDTQVVGFAAADIAVGVIVDEAAGTITAKRTGTWSAVAKTRLITDALGTIADGSYVSIYVAIGDSAARFDNYESLGGAIQPILITVGSGIIPADTAVTMTVYVHQASPTTYAAGSADWNYPYLSIVETL